jgi:uncharacterized membrane protein YjfL (UPF0719 family)
MPGLGLGLGIPFWIIVLIWLAKVVLLVLISALLAWLGVMALDALIRQVSYRERISESPVAIGLFIAGFFILIGLVIHGAITALAAVTAPIVWYIFDFRMWGILAMTFVISLLVGAALFYIVDKLTPDIPFSRINESPVAAGLHMFGYLVFFGLILHAALTGPLL